MFKQGKVVQLTQNNDYFPTVSLNSIFSKVILNFGREPFHFNFEMYVQTELASLLNSIDQQEVSKSEVKGLILNFTKHYGYSKTYSTLSKASCNKLTVAQKLYGCNKENQTQKLVAKSTSRKSCGNRDSHKSKGSVDISVSLETGSQSTISMKTFAKHSKSCLDIKNALIDKTYFSQRSLIHILMQKSKFAEAEKIISLCFPELVSSEILQAHLKVHGFVRLCAMDQLEALGYAKTHFVGSVREQKVIFCTADKLIGTAKIRV